MMADRAGEKSSMATACDSKEKEPAGPAGASGHMMSGQQGGSMSQGGGLHLNWVISMCF